MKSIFFSLGGSLLLLQTNLSLANEIPITVNNIDVERGGYIVVFIFSKNGFPTKHDSAILTQTKPVEKEVMSFSFTLDMDEVAVKVLHDEDEDGNVTKNWTGIYPKEGLGFSNDQQIGLTGPPNYEDSKQHRDDFKNGLNISISYP